MKAEKAAGADGATVKMLAALEEFGIIHLTNLLNKMLSEGRLQTEICSTTYGDVQHTAMVEMLENLDFGTQEQEVGKACTGARNLVSS